MAATPPGPVETNAQVMITNKIQFHGQVPDNQTNVRLDPLDVCPNVVDPVNHGIQMQPYQFEFESTSCVGNSNSTDCRFRPSFIWTIHYYTEAGATYTEQWQDVTTNDFSKIRLYLYDRVPYKASISGPATPTNGQATQAGGNTKFSAVPYPNLGCLQQPDNTAAHEGDPIVSAWLECTGYTCGFSGGDDTDNIHIRYYGRRPEALTLTGQQPLCRNTTYPVSANPVFAATNYRWYTNGLNGATITNINGNNATLDVSGVPAGTNSITLRVAAQDNAHCGNIISEVRELVVNLAPSPGAPQNMQLSNGLCPTTGLDTKTVLINVVPNAINYKWTISGAGSTFSDGTTSKELPSNSISIKTPQVGQVTVGVSAKQSDCNGYGATLTRTFQIGNLEPICKQPTYQRGPCEPNSFSLVFETNPTGLNYYFNAIRNVTNGGNPTVTQSVAGSPVFLVNLNNGLSSRFSFDLDYYVQSNCPSGPGFIACTANIVVGKYIQGSTCRTVSTPGSTKQPELYPNPASGTVEIRPDQPTSYQWLKVYDMQGKLRHEEHRKGAESIRSFDVRTLATGIYLVQLFDGAQVVSQRLVKE